MRRWLFATVMGLFFVGKAFGATEGSSSAACGALKADICYLSASELGEIQHNPNKFKPIFLAHKRKFISDLGPQFKGITESGAALAFAGVVAYELKAYRSTTDASDPVPKSRNIGDLMAVPRLVCDEYVSLAVQLFYLAYPQSNLSPIKINAIGWRRDSPVGNHAEFFVTGSGVPLLVDPDLGLIAKTTLYDVLNHVAVAKGAVFVRTNRPADAVAPLLLRVRNALANGTFDAEFMIYSFLARDVGQHCGPKYSYTWSDFTSSIAHGADRRIWYTTDAGAFYLISGSGVEIVQRTGVLNVESQRDDGAIYSLSNSGAVYRYARRNTKTLVRDHVDAVIFRKDGGVFYFGKRGNFPPFGELKFADLNIVGAETGLGGVDFKPRATGDLEKIDYNYRLFVRVSSANEAVAWIAAKKGGRGCYIRTSAGELSSVDGNGVMTYLASGIAEAKLGVGGLTINVLKFDGTVWQGNLEADGGRMERRKPQPMAWSEIWPGHRFASIELSNGGMTLEAVRFDGSHFVGSASTF